VLFFHLVNGPFSIAVQFKKLSAIFIQEKLLLLGLVQGKNEFEKFSYNIFGVHFLLMPLRCLFSKEIGVFWESVVWLFLKRLQLKDNEFIVKKLLILRFKFDLDVL
jgi:hypothetical protein